jgi:CBS domain-containing protein
VVVAEREVVGVFTERDVLRRVVAQQLDPGTTKLRDVMTTPVITCGPDTRIDECRAVISARRIRHLPVVEGKKLVGIVTSGDIHAQHLREQQEAIDYLHSWANEGR